MPLFFFVLGFILIDSGVRGNAKDAITQLASDLEGFLAFGAVILILDIAALSKTLRPIATGLLGLVFVVWILKNGSNVVSGVKQAIAAPVNSGGPSTGGATDSWDQASNSSNVPGLDTNPNLTSNLASNAQSLFNLLPETSNGTGLATSAWSA